MRIRAGDDEVGGGNGGVVPLDSTILVACCGRKLKDAAPAADLYISSLFKKSRTYAEQRGRWFILSALHGLVDPTAMIAPYNVTLRSMRIADAEHGGEKFKSKWSRLVWRSRHWSLWPVKIM